MALERYRSENSTFSITVTGTNKTKGQPDSVWSGVNSTVKTGIFKDMTDYVTPRFEVRKAAGVIVNNPLEQNRQEFTYSPKSYELRMKAAVLATKPNGTWSGIVWDGCPSLNLAYDGQWTMPPSKKDQLISIAATEALGRVESPAVQGLVDLAELRKTLSFLRNPIKSATDYLQSVAKYTRYGEKRLTKRRLETLRVPKDYAKKILEAESAAGSTLLAYRYGLGPLFGSAEGLIEALTPRPKFSNRRNARGKSSHVSTTTGTKTRQTASVHPYYTVKTDWVITSTEVVRAGILYDHQSIHGGFGTELDQLPMAAWELVPYSFVIDKIVNIGDMLQALTPKYGVKELSSFFTYTREDVVDLSITTGHSYALLYPNDWEELRPAGPSLYTAKLLTKERIPGDLRQQVKAVWTPSDWVDNVYDISTMFALVANVIRTTVRNQK